jgi:hypothetical protein
MPRCDKVSSATFQLGHHHHKVNKQTFPDVVLFCSAKMTSYNMHPFVVIYR